MSQISFNKALSYINKYGFLLVFPIQNKKNPKSLWYQLHPRTELRWEWDDTGDSKLFELWRLREELASSHQVVYGKFYQNRATFFSKETFINLLAAKNVDFAAIKNADARNILKILEADSPLSTKQIKKISELQGKFNQPNYNKAMKELWWSLAIVAVGEVDDGAFPSLAHSATITQFEELVVEARKRNKTDAIKNLEILEEYSLVKSFIR